MGDGMGKAPQGAGDPETCRRELNVETIGEFLVGQLMNHPQLERFTFPRRECLELTLQREAGNRSMLNRARANVSAVRSLAAQASRRDSHACTAPTCRVYNSEKADGSRRTR
jgi:hypothetical protein